MAKSSRRFWIVECYDSTTLKYRIKVPASHYTDDGIEHALKALTAREGLEPDELLGAYARADRRSYLPLLEVIKGGRPFAIMCGTNPHVVARLVEEEEIGAVQRSPRTRRRKSSHAV